MSSESAASPVAASIDDHAHTINVENEAGPSNMPIVNATLVSARGHHFYVVKPTSTHVAYEAEKNYQAGRRDEANYLNENIDEERSIISTLADPIVAFITVQSTPVSFKANVRALRRNRIICISM
jgi:hypothetical protein